MTPPDLAAPLAPPAAVPRPALPTRPARPPASGAWVTGTDHRADPAPWPAARWRALLLGGLVAAAAATIALAADAPAADADLARLMRLMALVKASLVAVAAAALYWRLARPVAPWRGALYLGLAWTAAAATAAMWRLVLPGTVALVLHGAGLALLVLAWRDPEFLPAPRRAGPAGPRHP